MDERNTVNIKKEIEWKSDAEKRDKSFRYLGHDSWWKG